MSLEGVVHPSHDGDVDKPALLIPSPFNSAEAGTIQNDGTQWIFYYNIQNQLTYTVWSIDRQDRPRSLGRSVGIFQFFGRSVWPTSRRLLDNPTVGIILGKIVVLSL
ncbi:hypothetical protein MMC31_007126 [Peltigera leucophlebia]|nr:hypothetical protein [Peltigera leucophlebia]